jgi:hypothetical protein
MCKHIIIITCVISYLVATISLSGIAVTGIYYLYVTDENAIQTICGDQNTEKSCMNNCKCSYCQYSDGTGGYCTWSIGDWMCDYGGMDIKRSEAQCFPSADTYFITFSVALGISTIFLIITLVLSCVGYNLSNFSSI